MSPGIHPTTGPPRAARRDRGPTGARARHAPVSDSRAATGSGAAGARSHRRRLLQDDVGIGAAEAEGVDPGQRRSVAGRPRLAARRHAEAQRAEVDFRVGPIEVQVAGDAAMVKRQRDLDQPGDAGAGLEVADVRLHRADQARLFAGPAVGQDPSQGPGLDRVSHERAGAVGLDVLDRRRA